MELVLFPPTSTKRPREEISSQACNTCKKRKGKCNGNPCEYCKKKGITCEFSDGKKRGPSKKKIFPKGIREFENVYATLLSTLQRSINEEYHLHNFVDIYFQYFGHPIPKECKALLLSAKEKPCDHELTTQLYIISAHVMRFLGNSEIEARCIAEANRHVSNIFNCDSLASAISLIMMAMYLGESNPKSFFLSTTANNIAKMVVDLKPSRLAQRIFGASKFLKIIYDPDLSSTQKGCLIREMLGTNSAESNRVRTMLGVANVTVMLSNGGNFDCSTLASALNSISLPCNMPEEIRVSILGVVTQIEEGSKGKDIEQQFLLFLTFLVEYFKFVVEWRSGNMQEACGRLNSAITIFSNNRTLIGLWLQNAQSLPTLLIAPYFYQQHGTFEKMHESLQLIEEYAMTIGKREEFARACSAFGLPSSTALSIAQIEQELLGQTHSAAITEITNIAQPNITIEEFSDILV